MIICMNIGTDGERFITCINYKTARSSDMYKELLEIYKHTYDEVYVLDFKENKAFIDEVVLRGCRV